MKKLTVCFLAGLLMKVVLPVAVITPATAQPLEWVKNATYQLKYQVPTHWTQLKQANDTVTMVTLVSPDGEMMLFIDKFKEAALQVTPQQALTLWLRTVGGTGTRFFPTRYHGIRFLEITGVGLWDGRLVRYDAMAAAHREHLILINVYATPPAYEAHQVLLQQVIHSISPYKGQ